MVNPLDNLFGQTSPDSKSDSSKKNKKKKTLKTNPIFKELRPVIIYGFLILVVLIIAKYTLFNQISEYSISNLTEGKSLTEQNLQTIKTSVSRIESVKSETETVQELINIKKQELEDANLVRTPLEQSFYFVAYLDSLLKKYDIELIDMFIKGSRSGTGETIDLSDAQALVQGDINILPIEVEFSGTYTNIALLFSDFYTKRIVYDEDLVMTNNFDGTVNVKMTVRFDNSTEGPQTGNSMPNGQSPSHDVETEGQMNGTTPEGNNQNNEQMNNPTNNQNNFNPNYAEGQNNVTEQAQTGNEQGGVQ